MPEDADRLIWIDMEMTGLKPDTDRIIEVALVVTDANSTPSPRRRCGSSGRATRCSPAMDAWNQSTHGALGAHRPR